MPINAFRTGPPGRPDSVRRTCQADNNGRPSGRTSGAALAGGTPATETPSGTRSALRRGCCHGGCWRIPRATGGPRRRRRRRPQRGSNRHTDDSESESPTRAGEAVCRRGDDHPRADAGASAAAGAAGALSGSTGLRSHAVKASGWPSLDRQFESLSLWAESLHPTPAMSGMLIEDVADTLEERLRPSVRTPLPLIRSA